MKMKAKVLIPAIATLLSLPAFGKITHNYKVTTQVKNSNGNFIEFAKSFNGWDCSTYAKTSYSEVMLDHRGDYKRVEQSAKADYKYSTLWQGQPAYQSTVQRSFNNEAPQLLVSVQERCSKSKTVIELETKTRQVYTGQDANGNSQYRTETYTEPVSKIKTVYANQYWNCRFHQMPEHVGDSLDMACESERSFPWMSGDTMHFTTDTLLLNFINDKDISVNLNLYSENENFIKLNTESSVNSEQFVFKVYQGLRGSFGEDDFKITISVDGASKTISSSHGLINEDFVYFAPEGTSKINVNAKAIEEDLIFDDEYETFTSASLYKGTTTERTILLSRGSYHSNLKVKMIKSPGIEKVSDKIDTGVAAKMIERYEAEKKNVALEIKAISELEEALKEAEDNYDFTKMISIPVVVTGGVVTAIGGYQFSQTGIARTATKVLLASGIAAITGGTTAIILKGSAVRSLLKELIEKRKDFEELLNSLDEKSLKVHSNTSYILD